MSYYGESKTYLFLGLCLSVSLSLCLCLSASVSLPLSLCLSVCLSVCLSLSLSLSLSFSLSLSVSSLPPSLWIHSLTEKIKSARPAFLSADASDPRLVDRTNIYVKTLRQLSIV